MHIRMLLLAAAALTPAPALAQDVVVMRRQLTQPSLTATATWTPDPQWTWSEGPSCRPDAPRHRAVRCLSDGREVAEAFCAGKDKPDATSTAGRWETCSYSWSMTSPGVPSSTCQVGATRTPEYACLRSGTTQVDATECTSRLIVKPTVQPTDELSGCTYGWHKGAATWSSTCSADARLGYTVSCRIKNPVPGDTAGKYVSYEFPQAMCDQATKPASTDPDQIGNWSGCSAKIYDPGFETTIWQLYGDHTDYRVSGIGRSGNAGVPGDMGSDKVSLPRGTWKVTFWARALNGSAGTVQFQNNGQGAGPRRTIAVTGTWVRYDVTITLTSGGDVYLKFYGDKSVAIDDVNIAPVTP